MGRFPESHIDEDLLELLRQYGSSAYHLPVVRASGLGLHPLCRCRNGAFNATSEAGRRASRTDEIGLGEICEAIAADLIQSLTELEARKRKLWATSTASTRYGGSDNKMPTCPGVRLHGCGFWPNRTWVGLAPLRDREPAGSDAPRACAILIRDDMHGRGGRRVSEHSVGGIV